MSLGLAGRKALVVGVANKHSLAFAIVQGLQLHGCSVGVVSAPVSFERAKKAMEGLPLDFHIQCDVTKEEEMNALSKDIDGLDCLVHSIAYAPPEAFQNSFKKTSLNAFNQAMHVSTYSLIELVQKLPLNPGASVVALSYLGAIKAIPNYNVMGPAKAALEAVTRALAMELGKEQIRVNCVSAGPVNTLSARGIPGISKMRQNVGETAPLGRNITPEEVANVTAFLCSPLASGITGQTIYVDAGMSSVAMVPPKET
ncbi:enoyl-ACP reductase [Thraustotheca clavata]|uniref:Enoyl-ACP reductase n=1 Tax=Thraustotheca clavata TaxID=74557 RepID=A0A1V9ZX29_9STRA|nr:enoyl-ACP reductase [Thraustotheca clavata]